jgi:outer membrane protein OmpA-like peptidoglycan-associated protein
MRTFALIFLVIPFLCYGQQDTVSKLEIETNYTVDQMVDKVLKGKGMRTGNIKVSGNRDGLAYFRMDTSAIGIKSGLLLTTGNPDNVAGPNTSPGTSGFSTNKGDAELNKIVKGKTRDAVVIEFEFVPFHNKLSFNYVFGSEEYREYVGSSFNDGFAFLVSGPGFKRRNIALLPGSKIPVTINNVSHKRNSRYYLNNDYWENAPLKKKIPFEMNLFLPWYKKMFYVLTLRNPKKYIKKIQGKLSANEAVISQKLKSEISPLLYNSFQYDGFTTVLKAECYLKPFKKYKIKIVIGDTGDGAYDSGLFIGENSFTSTKDTTDPNYIAYKDISQTMDWDSIFNNKKAPLASTKKTTEPDFPGRVYFGVNEFDIPDSCKIRLDQIAEYLKRHPEKKCELTGYTDNTGNLEHNKKLSQRRAMAVMYYFIKVGVSRHRILYSGKSYEQPIGDNNTEDGKARNRRVEINIVSHSNKQ